MEEKRTKLWFSIPSKPKAPNPTTTHPAAFSIPAVGSAPVPRFITAFEPSQTLATPAAPAVVIAPLPNSRKFSTAPTGDGPVFVPDASDNDPSSSSTGYGLAVRDTEKSKRRRLAAQDAAAANRRFKQDMAALPDIQRAEEYDEVPIEGFGAALLAGYGWKEGNAIGRDKTKVDVKIMERGRRSSTNGLGADPLDKSDPAVTPVVRRSVRVIRETC